ncbi:BTB/POZ domain-containing protein [Trifolium pratense]|uniref:BTB/POZ domain-containing protein n=1 Tax=Trifolium pratense TaxID=57577 RepID=A0A2K3NQR6_TRIPR|nr:BTB/POZ domain-containing protein [Trifolium pratense]
MAYFVKSLGYFAQWNVNGNYLNQNESDHISEAFKIAMWQWRIMISRSRVVGAQIISLYPMEYSYKIEGGLNPPIASFQIKISDTIGKHSQILAMSEEVRDWQFNFPGRGTFTWICDIELPEAYYIELEFSHLQSSNTAFALGSKSSVFKQMFKEGSVDTITISDMATIPCQKFIDYFYDILRDEDLLNYSRDLLEAAKKYDVTDMIKDIEKRLARDINTQNVVERMKIAYRYELETLRDRCVRLILEFKKFWTIRMDLYDFLESVDREVVRKVFRDFCSVIAAIEGL